MGKIVESSKKFSPSVLFVDNLTVKFNYEGESFEQLLELFISQMRYSSFAVSINRFLIDF